MTAIFDLREWERFCETDVRAAARDTDRAKTVSGQIWDGIRERKYLGLFHPAGGSSRTTDGETLFRAMDALAQACASTFWRATISSALAGRMISELGNETLRARWIRRLASGECVGCFAVTERGSTCDPSSYRASVRRKDGGWVLTGEKTRISNAPIADVAAVLCQAIDEAGAALGLALVVTELRSSRVHRTSHSSLGLRGMSWGTLEFDDLPVGDETVILGTTMPRTLTVVEWGQMIQAMCGIALGKASLRAASRLTDDRLSFGLPLSQNSVVRNHVEAAHFELDAASLLTRDVVASKARGEIAGERIVMAKIFATEAGVRACETALKICGGWGYTTDLEVERYLRDAYGNIPGGLPNDRLRDLLMAPHLGIDPWATRLAEDE